MRFSTRLGGFWATLAVAATAACASPKQNADTTQAMAVDTVQPAMASTQAAETTKTATVSTTTTTTKKTSSKTISAKTAKDTAHLGRDSAIKIDTRDPRRQLPTIPPQKPPQ